MPKFESGFLHLLVLLNFGSDGNTGNPVGLWILVQSFKMLPIFIPWRFPQLQRGTVLRLGLVEWIYLSFVKLEKSCG